MTLKRSGERGQTIIEFAIVSPLLLVLAFALIEFSFALVDHHVVTRLAREGANMISRDSTLLDAATAMQRMQSRPVDFGPNSKLIFSVIKRGATTGTANFGFLILYQRYQFGSLPDGSRIETEGTGSFGDGPDFTAVNSDSDTDLRLRGNPDLVTVPGGLIYVAEIISNHARITPLSNLGLGSPTKLYSIAYF